MRCLLIIFLFSGQLFGQNIKITVFKFESNLLCHRLTYDDSAAIINLAEEEGVDSAFVMKISDLNLMITMKCEEYDIQYLLNDRYIDKVVKYYPNKTLFYDKNYNLFRPKTNH